MDRGATVIVAGAGALGLSTALALADAGCAVTVCDPAVETANASRVAAGMLAPAFETVLDAANAENLALLLAARDLWPELAVRAGVELDRSGAVAVGAEAWLAGIRTGLSRAGLHGTDLGRTALDAMAPGLSEAFEEGVMTREDWRLEPVAALKALRRAAAAAGVAFRAETVGDRGEADWLVAATGAAAGLAPELARLSPIKGHILRARLADVGRMSVRGEGAYAVPTACGLAIGATMEPGLADPTVDPSRAEPLLAAGVALFPALAGAPVTLAAGVRAATPDGLPMVGPSAEPRVLVAAGARRNGWLLAPLVAQIIAACVTGRDPGPYAARLDPQRFDGPFSAEVAAGSA
jgi:glycine oxidase